VHNEDSTLFSLDKLTQGASNAAPTTQAASTPDRPTRSQPKRDEESGLIDLDELARKADAPPTFSPYAPPPLHPFAGRPPLGAPAEETTLNGMIAARPSAQPSARWKVPALAAFVLVASVGFALAFRSVWVDDPALSSPAQTIVVLAPAPPPVEVEPRASDRSPAALPSTEQATPEALPSAARTKARRPNHSTTVPPSRPDPRRTDKPEPTKPPKAKDPCAHCGGDLSCAMRCSVRGSG
jgi:hypothetical protein